MCWCIRVCRILAHNLIVRFSKNVTNAFSCCFGGINCINCLKYNHDSDISTASSPKNETIDSVTVTPLHNVHDYVIVDEIYADYLKIERHKIETQPFYRTVDRSTAEETLIGREDGACLVRPYKESDILIKYIVSIYAQHQFFHLFIRQIYNKELYGIGQMKLGEKLFTAPTEIIEFYRFNHLVCTNKVMSLSLLLRPIIL